MKEFPPVERYFHRPDVREFLTEAIVVRARQEHELLKEELQDLYDQACEIRHGRNESRLNLAVGKLNDSVKRFVEEWSQHTEWEETELFPYAAWYLGEEPDLFEWMEREYELAGQFIGAFQRTLERTTTPVTREEARRIASYLLQAYAFLKNRFDEEEEIMRALSDRSNGYAY